MYKVNVPITEEEWKQLFMKLFWFVVGNACLFYIGWHLPILFR